MKTIKARLLVEWLNDELSNGFQPLVGPQVQEEMKKARIISSDSLICPTYFPAGTPCYQYLVHFHSVSLYELLPHCFFTENKLILLSLELGETKKDVLVILSRAKKSGNPIELWSK